MSKNTENFGEIKLDFINKKLLIYNEVYFYGTKANENLANQIAFSIQNDWNEANGKVKIKYNSIEETYSVHFEIKGFYKANLTEKEVITNEFPWRKYIRIEDTSIYDVSFVDAIFSNTGWFMLKNVKLPNSKTAAHEFGHSWGLLHPTDLDYRGEGQPHIMLPRGTLVDPEFRYKPEADAKTIDGKLVLEEGCTVHTDKRKVTQFNIDSLHLDKLSFNESGYADLSKLTNKFHKIK